MSFERLKKDLKAYDDRTDLSLEERLALFRSLESDLTELTKSGMDQYQMTEKECQSDSMISSMAWFGNLFHKLYSRNQSMVESYTGSVVRRFLNNANSSANSLNEEQRKLKEALERKEALMVDNQQLEERISVQQKKVDELLEQKRAREAELAMMEDGSIHAEVEALEKEILNQQGMHEQDLQALTKLRIELSELKENNESFKRRNLDPIRQEYEREREKHEELEFQYREKVEILKEVSDKVKVMTETLPQIKEQTDVQGSNLEAAKINLQRSQERLEAIKEQIEQKELQKKMFDDERIALEEQSLSIDTQVSTLKVQTIPTLKEKIAALKVEQINLLSQEQQCSTDMKELSKQVEEKALEVAEATRIRDEKQGELGQLSKDLDGLFQQNQNLKQSLSEGNPEETRQKLQEENVRLLESLEELQKLQDDLNVLLKDKEETSEKVKQAEEDFNRIKQEYTDLTERLKGLSDSSYQDELQRLQQRQEFLSGVADALKTHKQQMFANAEVGSDVEVVRQSLGEIGRKLNQLQSQILKLRTYFKENIL